MTAPNATQCPPESVLSDFGLGKLDAKSADTISQHIESCADCRQRVAGLSGDTFVGRLQKAGGDPGTSADSSERERSPGDRSNRGRSLYDVSAPPELKNHPDYEILKELGQGGMGTVYLAKNRMMDRPEVLKVISKALLDKPGALERFQQEIRSAAKLQHPNIVAAYSVLRPGDLLVFAMEYVKGQDLSQVVKARGALPVANAAFYVHQVANGLQHAHEKGMVHRDIKPNNLMLAIEGKKHVVKILDFGLAKATSEKGADGGLTKSGQMLGTPDYVAPEQTLDAHRADIRADVYSLGCTLYFLLSGGPPFQEQSLYAILEAHHKREPKPLNLVRPDVPVELATVVGKMMAKDPAKRYQTPLEVAKALVPFFKPGQSAASPPAEKPASGEDYPQSTMETAARAQATTPPPIADQPASVAHPLAPVPISIVPVAVPLVPPSADELSVSINVNRPAIHKRSGWSSLPPWQRWTGIGGGAATLLLGIALLVRTPRGTIEIQASDPNAKVTLAIDGDRVDISGPDKPLSLQVASAQQDFFAANAKQDGVKTLASGLQYKVLQSGSGPSPKATDTVKVRYRGTLLDGTEFDRSYGREGPASFPLEKVIKGWTEALALMKVGDKWQLFVPPNLAYGEQGTRDKDGKQTIPPDAALIFDIELLEIAGKRTVGKASTDSPPLASAPFDANQARAHQEAWAKHLGVPVEQTNSIDMKLALIPPGEFTMGSTPEQTAARAKSISDKPCPEQMPPHRITLTKPFLMGATEVTIGQFQRFAEAARYRTDAERLGGSSAGDGKREPPNLERSWRTPGYPITADSPVTQVTWTEAAMFCNWLSGQDGLPACYRQEGANGWTLAASEDGYRLPTEAEWEYACRAGTGSIWPFGDDPTLFAAHCWFAGNSRGKPAPAASMPPNGFGLNNMLGNVWEWCHDRYDKEYYSKSPQVDPRGPESGDPRSVRGGSFDGGYSYSAMRFNSPSSRHFGSGGFRVVRVSTKPIVHGALNDKTARVPQAEIISDKLKKPITAKFLRNTLEKQLTRLGEETGIEIVVLGDDLSAEGITKNQSFSIDEKDQTVADVLCKMLKLANSSGKLVYVIKPKAEGGEAIHVTTRAAAEKRGDALPPEPEAAETADQNAGSPAQSASTDRGWTSLFNGRDLSGWKNHPSHPGNWRAENGVLKGSGSAPTYLYSDREDWTDFHLRVETRVNSGGSAGVTCRAPFGPDANAIALGYLAKINANSTADGRKTGSLYVIREGGNYNDGTVDPGVAVGPDMWFTMDVIVQDNHVQIKVNDKVTTDYRDESGAFTRGHLALQVYQSGTQVEFRKIEIRKIGLEDSSVLSSPRSGANKRFPFEIPALSRGQWSIEGDELVKNSLARNVTILFGDPGWQDVDFSVEVKRMAGAEACGLRVRYQDEQNREAYSLSTWTNTLHRVDSIDNGKKTVLASQKGSLTLGKWYRLEVRVRGGKGECFLDGERIMTFESARRGRGRVGLWTWAACRFRSILVKAPDGKVLLEGLPDLDRASVRKPTS